MWLLGGRQPDHTGESRAPRDVCEVALDKFWYVESAVIVPCSGNGCREDSSCGVNGLEDTLHMAPAGDFLDKYRGQPF